tara:strand:- start:62 stop:442 length:381 start_codon:yes stop_codon:yes gene_type:complete
MPPKKINPKYIPKSLSTADKKKQIKSIKDKTDRPKLKSYTSKRSSWSKKFEDKYNTKITDKTFINKNIISNAGIEKILLKGKGAYYSSGSRPNQTAFSWAYGRLASVIMGGPARKVDKDIWNKYKK